VTLARRLHLVAILNRSSVLTDSDVARIVAALQKQVTNHFAPAWGIGARLKFVPKADLEGWKGAWNLVVLDTSDEATALGYHDFTPEGLPVGKAFAKTDQLYGALPSVTLSHELLEMLGDPEINLCAEARDGTVYAYENCDAVEADQLGYQVDGVTVSDFVTPEWFSDSLAGHEVRFDFRGHVSGPFELAAGGYISIRRPGQGWTQVFADEVDPLARPRVGSRRERRGTPLGQRRLSR
jgi:hypothetical protein